LNREYLYRVGPYGFIKAMSTKFEIWVILSNPYVVQALLFIFEG
jgi:hypothetical protein